MTEESTPQPGIAASTALGALGSKTMWVAGSLIFFPDIWRQVEPALREALPAIIGADAASDTLRIVGAVMVILRIFTSTALREKGGGMVRTVRDQAGEQP